MHVLRTEENRAEQQPYERIMVYFSAVTAQWIRVWPQRFCDGLRKCSPPAAAAATPPHWAHCCTQQISSLCYTSGVFWKRTGCLRGWGLRKECVCVCRSRKNTHSQRCSKDQAQISSPAHFKGLTSPSILWVWTKSCYSGLLWPISLTHLHPHQRGANRAGGGVKRGLTQ